MAKLSKDADCSEESLALEMIELNINEWDSLTRVFDMITNVCAELQNASVAPEIEILKGIDDETMH